VSRTKVFWLTTSQASPGAGVAGVVGLEESPPQAARVQARVTAAARCVTDDLPFDGSIDLPTTVSAPDRGVVNVCDPHRYNAGSAAALEEVS
jgi:hypothetical protein